MPNTKLEVTAAAVRERAKRFAQEYLKHFNAKEAAIAVGYSKKTAAVKGFQMLQREDVRKIVSKRAIAHFKRNEATIEELISILSDVSRADISDTMDMDGGMLMPHEMPERVRHAISDVEYQTVWVTRTITKYDEVLECDVTEIIKEPKQIIKKIKLGGKKQAIDMLMKYFGAYQKDNEQKNLDPIVLPMNNLEVEATTLEVEDITFEDIT